MIFKYPNLCVILEVVQMLLEQSDERLILGLLLDKFCILGKITDWKEKLP